MALLASQLMSPTAGLVASMTAAANDTTIVCDNNRTFLRVANGSGSSITVTVTTPGTDPNGNAIADATFTVAASATRDIPLNPVVYGSTATVNYSATTSVTHAAITLP